MGILTKALGVSKSLDSEPSTSSFGVYGNNSTLSVYHDNQYENGFSSIRAIANAFIQVLPYAVDDKGKKVQKANVVNKLYHPNQSMSSVDFREALAIMSLVHPKVYLLHWHMEDGVLVEGGDVTADNIAGFTFLEGVVEVLVDGETQYSTGVKRYTTQDVLVLKSINPYNLNSGFSPAQAARRWTKLDDYIAEYQAGFFENGAVPAGMFTITAKSVSDFRDIKQSLLDRNKGAGKNNNVSFNFKPADVNGQTQSAQIEWTPFNVQNKEMALKDIFEQVNKKIDSAYGVPASIRGVNDNNTYASVRVDEVIMAKYTVAPFLLKVWTKLTHELNRVSGGMGYAITYDYEIPQVADEELVIANTKKVEAELINTMIMQGYDLSNIVEAFKLPKSYLKLTAKQIKEELDNADVDMGDEVEDSPTQPIEGSLKSLKVKKLTQVDRKFYEDKVSEVVLKHMTSQVENAVIGLSGELASKAFGDTTKDDDTELADDILTELTPLIAVYGQKAVDEAVQIILDAGLVTDGIEAFAMSETQKIAYRDYLKRVATTYNDQTGIAIRQILDNGITNGATKYEIEQELRQIILGDANKYRITRLSKTEVNLSEGKAGNIAVNNIKEQTGYKLYKVWNVSGADPCEYCLSMDGTRVLVDENYVTIGHDVHGVDGGTYTADFKDTDTASLHPNCNCYSTYEVER